MKKIGMISIFIFLTGLFSGLFFSTDLSPENHLHLSALLMSGISAPSASFEGFLSALLSNLVPAALMLPALFTRVLSPLPMGVLFCKSFSLGFCGSLIHTASQDHTFLLSLLKFFPQNLFIVPAFILLASAVFYFSLAGSLQQNRSLREKRDLKSTCILSFALLLAGCIIQELFHLIAL